jgi:pimeloyl-ACP methyl ester carboxylesterase
VHPVFFIYKPSVLTIPKAKMYRWGNDGPHIVFLHYFGGEGRSWQWVARHLEQDYQCIAFDLPGFGESLPVHPHSLTAISQWVLRQLVLHDIFDCVLVGHSMGGKIAMQIAANPAQLDIRKTILIAPSPPTYEPMPQEEKDRMLNHPNREEAINTVKNATQLELNDAVMDFAVHSQLRIDHQTWKWWLLDGMNHSIAEQIRQISSPITVVCSEDDPVITMDTIGQEVIPHLPEAKLRVGKSMGHLLPLENPAWVANAIREEIVQIR